jgi:hypothetical protein
MIIFGGIVLHAPLSVWLGTIFPDYSLIIKAWKEIIMLVAVPIALAVVTRRGLWRELLHDWLMVIIALFALLHLILLGVYHLGFQSAAAGLMIDLRYFLFFCLVYVAIKVLPGYRRRMIQIGVIGAFIVVGFATVQLFLPADILSHIGYNKDTTIAPYLTVDKNPAFIRENSTLRGPNPLGAYAVMVLGLLAAALIRMRSRLNESGFRIMAGFLAVCSIVSLWVSYSRSALVAGIVAIVVGIIASSRRKVPRKIWITAGVAMLVLVGVVFAARTSNFVSNVILHENPNGGSSITSNDGHVSSLVTGWYQFVHQPFGAGVGSTGSASLFSAAPEIVENQYLFVAHEAGWIGLLLYMLISVIVLSRLWHRRKDWLALGVFAGGVGLMGIGLLLPVFTDDTVSIVWWGLAAVALGGDYARRKTK